MPEERFRLTDDGIPHVALVVAASALIESPDEGEVGPWRDDLLLRTRTIIVDGPDRLIELVGQRLIEAGQPFEVSVD